ncbi:phosphoglycerate kinase [Bdellovibrionota bacterium FG-2]
MSVPSLRTIEELEITGKRVLMRLSLQDMPNLQNELASLQYAVGKGAKVIVASHLGQPKGKRKMELSLEPVAHRLAELLGQEVTITDDCIGDGIELMAQGLKNGQILLLENLRFHSGEEANDPTFAHRLARLGEVYISDDFASTQNKHASTYGVPLLMPQKGIGTLIQKEMQWCERLLKKSEKPFCVILGGNKIAEKIKTIETLLPLLNQILLGGTVSHAFMAAQGITLPPAAQNPGSENIEAARSILRDSKKRDLPILLPLDTNQWRDIGPETIKKFSESILATKTIFWSGPLGCSEKPEFCMGTFKLAKAIAETSAIKIVAGDDTVQALNASGAGARFDHLSRGGNAFLDFITGKILPGLDAIKDSSRPPSQPL